MPKISVIVPVYNAEKYLHRCVDSILAQTFTDFELLLINDGSKDNCGAICDEYATKDCRVRVFHKENGGVSSARNLGLDNAQGKWITFVDSDDRVEDYYLQELYKNGCDLSACSYVYEMDKGNLYEKLKDNKIVLDTDNLTDVLMSGGFMTPYCKLFKSKIIKDFNIRFDNEISSGEDTLFVWTYILYIDEILVSSKPAYYYRITSSGLSHKRIPIDGSLYTLEKFYKLLLELQNKYKGYDIRYRLLWLVCERLEKLIREEVCDTKNYFQRREKLCKVLKSKSIKILLEDKAIIPKGIKRKIWDFLAINQCTSLLAIYTYYYKYD